MRGLNALFLRQVGNGAREFEDAVDDMDFLLPYHLGNAAGLRAGLGEQGQTRQQHSDGKERRENIATHPGRKRCDLCEQAQKDRYREGDSQPRLVDAGAPDGD